MKPKTPLISVSILTYNHEDFIAKAIEGVYMQNTNIPIELIVSNDCSSDNTDLIIQDLIKRCPNNIDFKYYKCVMYSYDCLFYNLFLILNLGYKLKKKNNM